MLLTVVQLQNISHLGEELVFSAFLFILALKIFLTTRNWKRTKNFYNIVTTSFDNMENKKAFFKRKNCYF